MLMYLFLLQQTKRKLDDANKRLEFLYDKLREQTVSSGFLGFFWFFSCPSNIADMAKNLGWTPSQYVAGPCSLEACFKSVYMFLCISQKWLGRVLGLKCLCRLCSVLRSCHELYGAVQGLC